MRNIPDVLFCFEPLLSHENYIFTLFQTFCMLFECLVRLLWFDNLKMLVSSIFLQFSPSFLIFLVPFNADFRYKSIASKITSKYGNLTEIQGKHCASGQRDRPHQKCPILEKKNARALCSANSC